MATTYRTRPGDVLDLICWRHYGHQRGVVEATLVANPALARQPLVLPGGLRITLPDDPTPRGPTSTVKLWD
jgi:phage tail protein X